MDSTKVTHDFWEVAKLENEFYPDDPANQAVQETYHRLFHLGDGSAAEPGCKVEGHCAVLHHSELIWPAVAESPKQNERLHQRAPVPEVPGICGLATLNASLLHELGCQFCRQPRPHH